MITIALSFAAGVVVGFAFAVVAYFLIWGLTPGDTFGPFFRRRV